MMVSSELMRKGTLKRKYPPGLRQPRHSASDLSTSGICANTSNESMWRKLSSGKLSRVRLSLRIPLSLHDPRGDLVGEVLAAGHVAEVFGEPTIHRCGQLGDIRLRQPHWASGNDRKG